MKSHYCENSILYFREGELEMRGYSLLEFLIQHANLKKGKNRLDVVICNDGDEVLRNIILLLRPIDKNNILVENSEQFIHALVPGKETIVGFHVSLRDSCSVFFSVTRFGNADDYFSATSLPMRLVVEDILQNDSMPS